MCNMAGQALRKWSMKARVNDVVITADSQVIVCITADKSIELMRLNDHVPVSTLGLMCIPFAFKFHCIHAFRVQGFTLPDSIWRSLRGIAMLKNKEEILF